MSTLLLCLGVILMGVGFSLMVWFTVQMSALGISVLDATQSWARQLEHRSPKRHRELAAMGLGPNRSGYAGTIAGLSIRHCIRGQVGSASHAHWSWGAAVPTGNLQVTVRPALPSDPTRKGLAFDAIFSSVGSRADIGWLTPQVREALCHLVRLRPSIEAGYVWLEHPDFYPGHVTPLLDLARLIARAPADPTERIGQMLSEPDPAVRAHCLMETALEDNALAQTFAGRMLGDPDERVRAEVAILLKQPYALWLATLSRLPVSVRCRTAEGLLSVGSPEERCKAGEALVSEPALLQQYAFSLLYSVGRAGEPGLRQLAGVADGELRGNVLLALEEVGSGEPGAALASPADQAPEGESAPATGQLGHVDLVGSTGE